MHLFKQNAVKDVAAISELIPVIDYGPVFRRRARRDSRHWSGRCAMPARMSASCTR